MYGRVKGVSPAWPKKKEQDVLPPLIYSWHDILYHRIWFMSVYNQSTLSLPFGENPQLDLQRLRHFFHQAIIQHATCLILELCFV